MRKNINIAIINRYFYPVTAGIETYLLEIGKNLHKQGYKINVHVSKNTLNKKNEIVKTNEIIEGIKIKRYKTGILGFFPKIDWKNTDLILLENFTLSPNLYILLSVWFLKLLGKKKFKLILEPHGGFTPPWYSYPKIQRFIKRLIHNSIGKFLITRSVDYIRAVAEVEKEDLIKAGINSSIIHVINNGIEQEAFTNPDKIVDHFTKKSIKSMGDYIIQIGRVTKIKNYETVIKALPKVNKNIKFLIVGPVADEGYKKELDMLINKLNLNNRVIFMGIVRGAQKYFLIKHAKMMVHMAEWEANSIAVLEGMSQGKVCIVSDHKSLSGMVKDGINGFVVPVKDSTKLANRMKHVLRNIEEVKIKKIEKYNKKQMADYTWENISIKISQFIQDAFKANNAKINSALTI